MPRSATLIGTDGTVPVPKVLEINKYKDRSTYFGILIAPCGRLVKHGLARLEDVAEASLHAGQVTGSTPVNLRRQLLSRGNKVPEIHVHLERHKNNGRQAKSAFQHI